MYAARVQPAASCSSLGHEERKVLSRAESGGERRLHLRAVCRFFLDCNAPLSERDGTARGGSAPLALGLCWSPAGVVAAGSASQDDGRLGVFAPDAATLARLRLVHAP